MKRSLYILLLSGSLAACTDKLEQVNPNVVTQETFWKTENDVLSALAATYKTLKQQEYGYWAVRGVELTNGRGDDFFIRNDVKDLYQLSTFTNNPTTGTPSNLYATAYTGIFRANQLIEKVPNAQIPEEAKAHFIAEARFLRALNYFHLAINFGAVPLLTTVPQEREAYFVKQSPEAEVWQQVESDLMAAKADLPVSRQSLCLSGEVGGSGR
jgi:hypothetical protein